MLWPDLDPNCLQRLNATRLSNSLDPDQTGQMAGLIWIQPVCKNYHQMNVIRVSNSLNQDQVQQYFGADLDPTYLQWLNETRISNHLDPDQTWQNVRPDLDPNCLQRLAEMNAIREPTV